MFFVPAASFAAEDHFQVMDTAVSTQLSDDDSYDSSTPVSERSAEHCGHCAPMPLRSETASIVQMNVPTLVRLPADSLPRLQLVARVDEPPRH